MGLDKGGVMKGYLFGLGAMLVGAGLMFVLMHGEVSAEDATKMECELFIEEHDMYGHLQYCKINDLTCVNNRSGISCVKS
jgi:hypothetical protein